MISSVSRTDVLNLQEERSEQPAADLEQQQAAVSSTAEQRAAPKISMASSSYFSGLLACSADRSSERAQLTDAHVLIQQRWTWQRDAWSRLPLQATSALRREGGS
jgi:hypothetical protein